MAFIQQDRMSTQFFISEVLKHVQISYEAQEMNNVLQIALDVATIKEALTTIEDVDKFDKVEIWFDGHCLELKPKVETKTVQDFKGFE